MTYKMSNFIILVSILVLFCFSATQVTSSIPNQLCPIGWTLFSGACYQYFDKGRTWKDAEATCQFHFGSHLAGIHSKQENKFIVEFSQSLPDLDSDIWIGITKPMGTTGLVWTDGSSVSFTNWGYPPHEYPARHLCGKISTRQFSSSELEVGKWGTAPCEVSRKFMCKFLHVAREFTQEFSPNNEIGELIQNLCHYMVHSHYPVMTKKQNISLIT